MCMVFLLRFAGLAKKGSFFAGLVVAAEDLGVRNLGWGSGMFKDARVDKHRVQSSRAVVIREIWCIFQIFKLS